MPHPIPDPFGLTAAELQTLLLPGLPHLPELAQSDPEMLRRAPQTQVLLAETQPLMDALSPVPSLNYTHYRLFARTGDRKQFETPYFLRRANLSAAAVRLWLGQADLTDVVQDYLWAICEESNWVLPAHENDPIDLFAAETGFMLAELLAALGHSLAAEIRWRVRREIERRIFEPYLRLHRSIWWYKSSLNWNGVCNSSIAATFLLLEPEAGRAAQAVALALAGLRVYLDTAFERDGSSTEGVGYWHYGLINFVALAEMLRARTAGAIDLLNSAHVRHIAAFPPKMLLSAAGFATFSDCDETVHFEPGIITRLAERTGVTALLDLLTPSQPTERLRWFPMHLRNMLWWDGQYHQPGPVDSVYLPLGATARLAVSTPQGEVVVAVKAGHNDENHNQNDVGSFILHAGGETLLTDPGRGLYTRQYFGPERYHNIFANSYGHSVPRIGGQLQREGREFRGKFVEVDLAGPDKRVEIEFARAYPVEALLSARRLITLAQDGVIGLQDTFAFTGEPAAVEEALLTWAEVAVDGPTAVVCGQHHRLQITIEEPAGGCFAVEALTELCQANAKPGVLKRLSVVLPLNSRPQFRARFQIISPEN